MTDDSRERPDDRTGPTGDSGSGIVNASFAGTGVLLVAGTAGALMPESFGGFTAIVSGALFVIGAVAFLWGYATGVVRSREEHVSFGDLFFLVGTAPAVVRFRLRLAFAAQVVVAVVAAASRPYTAVAFAVLAPMFGLGLLAMWAARHGAFPPKEPG